MLSYDACLPMGLLFGMLSFFRDTAESYTPFKPVLSNLIHKSLDSLNKDVERRKYGANR